MSVEYVRLLNSEIAYGHQSLLKTQLSNLTILKNCKEFKEIRNEEFVLKIALKVKIEEALASLDVLEKILPVPTIKPTMTHSAENTHVEKQRSTLEDEIMEIRNKLIKLQSEY